MNLLSIYSVPIWQSEYPEFLDEKKLLLDVIKKYKEETPSIQKSNIFGYQSLPTLQTVPELHGLYEYICQMVYKASADLEFIDCDVAITSAWLNINDTKICVNGEHIHDQVFSGVFYLSAPEKSGNIVFKNPAMNPLWSGFSLISQKNQFTAENIKIVPTEGNILLFPSYLPHYVEPNDHDEERISISFNVIALPKGSISMMQNNPNGF